MPYLPTITAYLDQTTLLLSARPTTTRITTKYTIIPPSPLSPTSTLSQNPSDQTPLKTKFARSSRNHTHIRLKTYDPHSGVCLKYRTDKAAEIGRLVSVMAGAGRVMAGLPPKVEREGETSGAGLKEEKREDGKGMSAERGKKKMKGKR